MSSAGVAALLAFAAGLGGATQIAVQGRLGDRVGTLEAVATAAFVGGTIALATLLVARGSLGGIGDAVTGPKWQLLGGVMSVFIVLTITVSGPRIGVVATTAFLIAAQLCSRRSSTATAGSESSLCPSHGHAWSASCCSSQGRR